MERRDDIARAVRALADALADALQHDPELRRAVARLVAAIRPDRGDAPQSSDEATGPADAEETPVAPALPGPQQPASPLLGSETPAQEPIRGPKQVLPLRIGDSEPVEAVIEGGQVQSLSAWNGPVAEIRVPQPPRMQRPPSDLPDLGQVQQSASVKAEACRSPAGPALDELRRKLEGIRADGLTPADLWMFDPARRDPQRLALGADAYDALALAAALGLALDRSGRLRPGGQLDRPFALIAQAQSAIRRLVDEDRDEMDSDQFAVFRWLRTMTAEDQCRVRVERYMRRGDIADPADAPDLLVALRKELQPIEAEQERQRILGNLRYKANRLARGDRPREPEEVQRMDELVRDLAALGERTSSERLGRALAPVLNAIGPERNISKEFREALTYARRRVESEARGDEPPSDTGPDPVVAEAASLLRARGVRRLAVVGGVDRPEQRHRLQRDFDLEEVVRIEAHADKANADIGARVRASKADLVLVTRWLSHAQVDAVLEACRAIGPPVVRLPYEAGLGSGRVAAALLEQLSGRRALTTAPDNNEPPPRA